jgi:hypothetical protein
MLAHPLPSRPRLPIAAAVAKLSSGRGRKPTLNLLPSRTARAKQGVGPPHSLPLANPMCKFQLVKRSEKRNADRPASWHRKTARVGLGTLRSLTARWLS